MNDETEAHEGLERFAQSAGINYERARAAMIPGDAKTGWYLLEAARKARSKEDRACVVTWLRLLAERGFPITFYPTGEVTIRPEGLAA